MAQGKRLYRPSGTNSGVVGIGVDSFGGQVLDPTENVKALNAAEAKRQDDLRESSDRLNDTKIKHIGEIVALRAAHANEIHQMETQRLDSIRQVDVTARNTAADRAADAIQALAATTAANAENLRTALANTAATLAKQTADMAVTTAKQTADLFEAVTRRVASLEATAYRGEGRQNISDPQMAELLKEVKGLVESRRQGTGRDEGIKMSWGVFIGGVTVATMIAGALGFTLSSRPQVAPIQPQVIYAIPPTGVPPPAIPSR